MKQPEGRMLCSRSAKGAGGVADQFAERRLMKHIREIRKMMAYEEAVKERGS